MEMVFDASTLILLAKIELLREIAGMVRVIITETVEKECLSKEGIDAILIATLIKEKRILVKNVTEEQAINKIQRDFKLEAGEAESLWLARKLKCPLAVDDGPTIKACKVIGLRFSTAIHFLLNLTSEKRLDLNIAMAKLEKLSIYGRYNRKIIEDAMKRLKGGI